MRRGGGVVIEVVTISRPVAKRWRICRTTRTTAGIKTESVPFQGADALILHAVSAEVAVERAKKLMPWIPNLVAIPEAS